MGKVQILSREVSQLIAAGEVVERPASIVKELVENAVDAGATAITVEIKNGGISYIRVTDNGSGMDRGDLQTAFLRHATSKIHTQEDLNNIATLGFRGEALASIAAVCRVEVMSRTQQSEFAYAYTVEGGESGDIEEVGAPLGTSFIVRDLFFNTPARMKFLKKDTTEGNSVVSIVQKIALSHPEISFKMIKDQREVLHTPGDGNLLSVIRAVFNKNAGEEMLPVLYSEGAIRVEGYVSKPLHARANRALEHFFVNNRYVKTQVASIATEQAYKGLMMAGKFPSCVLNVVIPGDLVDINVHPAKTEVRFHNEREVFSAVYAAVKSALMEYATKSEAKFHFKTPETVDTNENEGDKLNPFTGQREGELQELKQESLSVFAGTPMAKKTENSGDISIDFPHMRRLSFVDCDTKGEEPLVTIPTQRDRGELTLQEGNMRGDFAADIMGEGGATPLGPVGEMLFVVPEEGGGTVLKLREEGEENENSPVGSIPEFRVVGEIFHTYILMEQSEKLFFIDKHAAHERILYEKLMAQKGEHQVQLLMSPLYVTLSMEEYTAVLDNLPLLQQAGFLVEDFGQGTVVIREIPSAAQELDIKDVFLEVAQNLADNLNRVTFEKLEWLYQSISCRGAIKAGDTSTVGELEELVRDIYRFDLIKYCPHGRPIMVQVLKRDIEAHFGR